MDPLGFLEFVPDFTNPAIVNAFDEQPLWSAMFGLLLLEHVPLEDTAVALDVGCGTGFPLIELAERLGPGCKAHGIDPWREALKRAVEKISGRGLSNVTLHEGTATNMPFRAATFDLIVSNLGLNNFDDRSGALRECRRVAKTGAAIVLTTNLQGTMKEFYRAFESVLKNLGDDESLARLRDHVSHRATVAGVMELLQDGGFSVSRVIERQAAMRFASGTAFL